jgi:hypothetical protein
MSKTASVDKWEVPEKTVKKSEKRLRLDQCAEMLRERSVFLTSPRSPKRRGGNSGVGRGPCGAGWGGTVSSVRLFNPEDMDWRAVCTTESMSSGKVESV